MSPRFILAGALLALALIPSALFGATPPTVTIDATLDKHGELAVTTTSHMPSISAVTMEVTTAGELFTIDSTPIALYLPLEVPVTVRIPVATSRAGLFGAAIIRLTNSRGTVHVAEIGFVRRGAAIQRVPHSEYAAAVNAVFDDRDAAAAEKRAEAAIKAVLARGKIPVAAGGELVGGHGRPVEGSNFERAWNRLVAQYNAGRAATTSRQPRPDIICGPYVESPDNRDFPLQGWVSYRNDHFGSQERALQESGYPGFVTTNVAFENDCFVQYRIRAFDFTTGWGGYFSTTVRTIDEPSYTDPILYVSVTAPDVGERSCAGSCTTIITSQQLLYPPNDRYQFVSGTIQIRPYYDGNSANRYFFHWNDEIKMLQRQWSSAGFGAGYTPFIAGHDVSVGNARAYFYQVPPGIVAFSDDARWVELWVVAHECGHFFQFKLQGDRLGNGQAHTVCGFINQGPAFIEGFADWHGSWWEADGRGLYMPCDGAECYSNCGTGYSIELNIAAFFWDVFDGVNHANFDQNLDTVAYNLTLLYNWPARDYTSFEDFYSDFRDRGAWGASEPVTATLRTVNRVNVP